jgi:hypothetical protein
MSSSCRAQRVRRDPVLLPAVDTRKVSLEPLWNEGPTDTVLREGEGRLRDLLRGVLVPIGEARQAPDAHHDDTVTGAQFDARRGRGDRDVEPVPRAHRVDRRSVRRVAAGLDAPPNFRRDLLDSEHPPLDGDITREHAIGESETKIRFVHVYSPHYLSLPNTGRSRSMPNL